MPPIWVTGISQSLKRTPSRSSSSSRTISSWLSAPARGSRSVDRLEAGEELALGLEVGEDRVLRAVGELVVVALVAEDRGVLGLRAQGVFPLLVEQVGELLAARLHILRRGLRDQEGGEQRSGASAPIRKAAAAFHRFTPAAPLRVLDCRKTGVSQQNVYGWRVRRDSRAEREGRMTWKFVSAVTLGAALLAARRRRLRRARRTSIAAADSVLERHLREARLAASAATASDAAKSVAPTATRRRGPSARRTSAGAGSGSTMSAALDVLRPARGRRGEPAPAHSGSSARRLGTDISSSGRTCFPLARRRSPLRQGGPGAAARRARLRSCRHRRWRHATRRR